MLDEFAIKNFGLIEEAQISLQPGLVVVTGETGTGKTMLVGGLRLLLGQKARKEAIGPVGDTASVEGRFVVDGAETVARRTVGRSRSRAYLDGAMATADELQRAVGSIAEVVAQHDQLALRRPDFIRQLIDSNLDDDGKRAVDAYVAAFMHWRNLQTEAEELGGDRRVLERELELANHQASEIEAAAFEPGMDTELQTDALRLRNREELLERFEVVRAAVETARDAVGEAVDGLRRANELDPSASAPLELLESTSADLAEVDGSVRILVADLPADSADLDVVERKLATLADLKRKYGDTLEDVLIFAKEAAARADRLGGLLERADTIAKELSAAETQVRAAGKVLLTARMQAGELLATAARSHLLDMGMAAPVVRFAVAEAEPAATGTDRCELLFASDDRLEPGPVQRVASGGELSRLTLALRLASGADDMPVLVFDEVDAGVGGATGLAVGRKLAQLAAASQVLCVTHLPQVAAFATQHLVVERTDNRSGVRLVTESDRAVELARMLSGMADSEDAQRHAEELLAEAHGSAE